MRNGIASLLIGAVLVSGCASTTPVSNATPPAKPSTIKQWMESRSKKGAIIGFIAGALIGAAHATLTGGNSEDVIKEALAGGVVGAMAGFAIGKHKDKVYAHRDYAVSQAGYDSSQGYVARVDEVAFDPTQPKPGTTATLYVRYMVIGPNPKEKIKVRLFRGLKYGEDYIFGAGPNEFTVPNGGGIVESTVEVTLSKKAPQGTYSVEALIADSKARFPEAIGTGAVYVVARAKQDGAVIAAP